MHNHENDIKYDNRARQFFLVEDLDTRANLCENNYHPESIKNDNGSIAMRKHFVQRERNQQIHKFKKYNIV